MLVPVRLILEGCKVKRFFAFAAVIVLVVLIESAVLSNWYILSVPPDILLLVVLYIGFHNGVIVGQVSGFASGLLLDFLSAAPFGLNAMIRTIMGFLSGLFYKNIHTTGLLIPAILGFVATLFKAFIIFCISFFYPNSIVVYSIFSSTLWYESILNTLLAPIIFWLLSCFTILASDYSQEDNK